MPVELLPFPPLYCIVGAYRLCTDESLYKPIWNRSQQSLKRALLLCIPLLILSYFPTSFYTKYILSRSPFSPKDLHSSALLGVSPLQYTTWMLLFGQITFVIEWLLKKQLKKSRTEVYDRTVQSRGKPIEFWGNYVEEWKVPPVERAKRSSERQSFYQKLSSPIFQMFVLRVLLTPLSFIPGLALCVLSSIRSLTLARTLHQPYFKAKRMSSFEVELWVVERQTEYRLFGFAASVMERIPIFGLLFSISNRIGAAMYAHDLEKRQHEFRSGDLKPTKIYSSKTARIAQMQSESGIPEEIVHGVGGFPGSKGPIKITKDGEEIGKPLSHPPALPPR